MRLKMQLSTITTLLAIASVAAAFEVNPGKWQITTTTKMAMMPEPQTKTSTECIKEKTADEMLKALTQEDVCKIKKHEEKGDTLQWDMECHQEGSPPMNGTGSITSKGETLSGRMNMSMKMGEQEMKFETTWNGKRLGACD